MTVKPYAFLCVFWFIFLQIQENVDAAKILGVFPAPPRSHYEFGSNLLKELARKGHEVTVISWYEEKDLPKNYSYKTILLKEQEKGKNAEPNMLSNGPNPYELVLKLNKMGNGVVNNFLANQKVQELLNSNKKFDAIIMDQFVDDGLAYLANHFDAHRIILLSAFAHDWINNIVGNTAPPSVVPDHLLPFSTTMTFWERLQNSLFYLFNEFNRNFIFFPQQDKIIKKSFPNSKPLNEYLYNVSLVLANTHESYIDPVALVPNIKNVGGIHLKPPGKLPKDLQDFMDNAKDGVIYFSLGSNLKSKDLPEPIRDAILRVFSKLKTKILWKWEDEILPGQPSNVKLQSWLPQAEILAHSNLKVFITHGGLLSIIEAVFHGVPLLTLPVYGDQNLNGVTSAKKGYSINLPFNQFQEEKFESALKELLENPRYKENTLLRKQIFHDRPIKPLDEAVYWVEYVIRHGGAEHLRVAALNLTWYQYLLLDVILFLVTSMVVVYFSLKMLLKKLFAKKKHEKTKKKTN